ncbi:universal stress protein [Streptomyces sp. G-G2]|uniref:universal stress protein n=1 Tax=Streptomyces sp. G-G2 TaxID=3046201 RepID=UPI0024B981D5|nr:universal stress protein [Streptomyces sp. G-G2]MDJ0383542.1 universal stress protein [Streptomyces sp. G-G2]
MEHHITVGLDGSPESSAAARWAAREARLRTAKVRLIHAEDWASPLDIPAAVADVRHGWAEALLRESADDLRRTHPELDISTQSIDGPPAASLATAAATADMLVLGSRGLGAMTGFVLGSVGMAVLHATERPVVLVRSGEDALSAESGLHAQRHMVVGVDISRPCDALLAFAFEEASRRSCPLHALHIWMPPTLVGYGAAYDPRIHSQINESTTADLADALKPWRDKFPTVEVTVRTPMGHAAQTFLDAGAEAGLIVVGRRIRRSSFGTHIGSTTHAVIHHATSPVAVIAHD